MGTEVVALGLQQVGGQVGRAVAIVVGEGAHESRQRHAVDGRHRNDLSPCLVVGRHDASEVAIEQQVG